MAKHMMNFPQDELEASIVRALETAPDPAVPANFAAKLVVQLPPVTVAPVAVRHYGRIAAIACCAVLLGLLFALARDPHASPAGLAAEAILGLQFVLLVVWLAVRDLGSYFRWLA
jgi:hypothetical protein